MWEDASGWDDSTIAGVKHFAMASMDALGDWFFWTWKVCVVIKSLLSIPYFYTVFRRSGIPLLALLAHRYGLIPWGSKAVGFPRTPGKLLEPALRSMSTVPTLVVPLNPGKLAEQAPEISQQHLHQRSPGPRPPSPVSVRLQQTFLRTHPPEQLSLFHPRRSQQPVQEVLMLVVDGLTPRIRYWRQLRLLDVRTPIHGMQLTPLFHLPVHKDLPLREIPFSLNGPSHPHDPIRTHRSLSFTIYPPTNPWTFRSSGLH